MLCQALPPTRFCRLDQQLRAWWENGLNRLQGRLTYLLVQDVAGFELFLIHYSNLLVAYLIFGIAGRHCACLLFEKGRNNYHSAAWTGRTSCITLTNVSISTQT